MSLHSATEMLREALAVLGGREKDMGDCVLEVMVMGRMVLSEREI